MRSAAYVLVTLGMGAGAIVAFLGGQTIAGVVATLTCMVAFGGFLQTDAAL